MTILLDQFNRLYDDAYAEGLADAESGRINSALYHSDYALTRRAYRDGLLTARFHIMTLAVKAVRHPESMDD